VIVRFSSYHSKTRGNRGHLANASIHNFKTYAEGEPIPPVDPEKLKRRWKITIPWTREALEAAWQLEADISAVSSRDGMIRMLVRYNQGQLLAPWRHGEELHEAVFRIAATFPLRHLGPQHYMISGDERYGFDPNAFVQRLIEETGISHVWKPVQTKIPEGGRCFFTWRAVVRDENMRERVPTTEREAKAKGRQVLWYLSRRFSPFGQILSEKEVPAQVVTQMAATSFAEFLLDNIDLVRQLEDAFKDLQHIPSDPILSELERRAQTRV
jgi:hypothetical protein